MSRELRRFALGAFIVALLQTAVLGWMIYDRVSLISSGREIILEVVPADPRSLFRGDYVILNYAITRLKPETLAGDDRFERSAPIFVVLKKSEELGWQPVSVWNDMPSGTVADEIVIRGKVQWSARDMRVNYGIESYFVPEGEGKVLEKMVRERKLQVLVAVAPNGEAAIKGLMVDGKLRYEEPLL
jgi:uncharacterized membrane-anchored protein